MSTLRVLGAAVAREVVDSVEESRERLNRPLELVSTNHPQVQGVVCWLLARRTTQCASTLVLW